MGPPSGRVSERGVSELLVVVTLAMAMIGAWVTLCAVASIVLGAWREVRDFWRARRARREREGIHLDE